MRELTPAEQNEHAFPTLTQAQIDALTPFGERVNVPAGGEVWTAGTANMCMFIVLEGEMSILDGRSHAFVAAHHVGAFSGDIDILTGRATLVTAVAASDLKLLKIAADCVRKIVAGHPELGEIILRAFLLRRSLLQASGKVGVLIVGSQYSADVLHIREFLTRNRYPVNWESIESSPDAARLLEEFGVTEAETPLVVLPSGDIFRKPTTQQLANALGILRPVEDKVLDVVIVGAGPAGLAAAVYGASEGLSTLLVDEEGPGGQAGTSSRIENYMGFPLGISGQELADGAVAQAEKFGAQMLAPVRIRSLTCGEMGVHDLELEGVGKVSARCVVLATGAHYRELEVERLEEFEGRGIYYAATSVERVLCGEAPVAVVGAGNSAGQAAVFMASNAGHVYLVVRGDDLRKTMSNYLALRIEGLARDGRLTIMLESQICALHGEENLQGCAIRCTRDGSVRNEKIEAVFVMIGAVPRTTWLHGNSKVALDEKGFILTGQDLVKRGLWTEARSPYFLETACPGVFAVGDARSGSIKRVASAVGEGSMAIALAHQYLAL